MVWVMVGRTPQARNSTREAVMRKTCEKGGRGSRNENASCSCEASTAHNPDACFQVHKQLL